MQMAAVSDHGVMRGPAPAPLGALLVSRGFLSEDELADALAAQAEVGRPLGAILVERGIVRPAVVAQALASQHGAILKTEYGFATGFDSRLPAADTTVEPPVSPAPTRLGATLRLGPETVPPAPVDAADPPVQQIPTTNLEALEMELASSTAENEKLRARLGEAQVESMRLRSESEAERQRSAVFGARFAGLEAAIAALQAEKAQLQAQLAELRLRLG